MAANSESHFCGACAQPLGSNSGCDDCADWLLRTEAESVDEQRAHSVLDEASEWIGRNVGVGPRNFFQQVRLMVEMLRDALSREARLPWATVAVLVAVLAYVVSPIDLMPDWIPALGFTDDAAMVLGAIRIIRKDLRTYAANRGLSLADYGLEE